MDLPATTDLFRLFADTSRIRLLALLAEEELTVAELTRITGLTQSRVSTHLRKLRESGFVIERPDGAATWHRIHEEGMDPSMRSAWELFRSRTRDPLLDQDQDKLQEVLGESNGVTSSWADSVAGQMDRHYSPGRTWEATAWGVIGLTRLGEVLDLASGDGVLAELLAPRARSVTCVDVSEKVAAAGRERLSYLKNVSFEQVDMHELPFADESFDEALLMNALTYASDPRKVLRETHRVLKPGGALVGVTLNAHRHEEAVRRFNHAQLGFEPDQLKRDLKRAGFDVELCRVTARERRRPCFETITMHARKPTRVRKPRAARPRRPRGLS